METLEKTTYTTRLLKKNLLALDPNLKIELRNVNVNGVSLGASGFISSDENIVYLNTDNNHGQRQNDALYRTAKSNKDYSGGRNNFSNYDNLAVNIIKLLASMNQEVN